MARVPAIQDVSKSSSGNIVGNTSKTVLIDGKPVVLEGSVSSSGATVLSPKFGASVYIENRLVAANGDALSDGTTLLERKEK